MSRTFERVASNPADSISRIHSDGLQARCQRDLPDDDRGPGAAKRIAMKHRVLIAEDHTLLRAALRAMILPVPYLEVVGEARDGKEAMHAAFTMKPDVVTMDLSMPNMGGIEATRLIKQRDPRIRVVVLSSYRSEDHVRDALGAGADGYVLKDSAQNDVLTAIRSVLNGRMFLSPEISVQVVQRYLQGTPAGQPVNPLEQLTVRERSILKLVSEGRTNRTTAEYLNVSPKTVEKHRASLMHKLGLRSATELVLMALQKGWVEREHMSGFADSQAPCHASVPASRV